MHCLQNKIKKITQKIHFNGKSILKKIILISHIGIISTLYYPKYPYNTQCISEIPILFEVSKFAYGKGNFIY